MAGTDGEAAAIRIEPQAYGWHAASWSMLTRDPARLPHALLLYGQAGLGKKAFALRLARHLLCQHKSGDTACGECQGCQLFRVGNHPDLLCVGPQEESVSILVDQIREVVEFLAFKPHIAKRKIVIIAPAEAMNVNAANALLKSLEEPPPGALLILVATHLSRLPMTIRSRCTRVVFSPPPRAEALAWLRPQVSPAAAEALLEQVGGAPLAAAAMAQGDSLALHAKFASEFSQLATGKMDPVLCAERWKVQGSELCLEWMHRYTATLIARVSVTEDEILPISIIDLFTFLDNVSISRRQLGTGVDEGLLLENLLVKWCEFNAGRVRN